MLLPPNQVYTAFSSVSFVMCVIPFYWHLEAWNTGICLYMAWTGLGCLLQCINSILWNNNPNDRAPVYCDVVTRIQVALIVAIPASSLCINRRLHKIASVNAVIVTRKEKYRAIMTDLLIGIGIPILQIITQYFALGHRYNIYEKFGPKFVIVNTPPALFLFFAWPVAIGCVSLVYCVRTIVQFRQMISFNLDRNLGFHLRLMVLSSIEILGTIPLGLGTYFIVKNAQRVALLQSGTNMPSNSSQIPIYVWKSEPHTAFGLEAFRWTPVACAFIFFMLFGFAVEARDHYRLVYAWFVRCFSSSTSSRTQALPGPLPATSLFGHSDGNGSVTVVTANGDTRDSTVPATDRPSIPSVFLADDIIKPDFGAELSSVPVSVGSPSSGGTFELEPLGASLQLEAMTPAVYPASASDLPHTPDTTHATTHAYS